MIKYVFYISSYKFITSLNKLNSVSYVIILKLRYTAIFLQMSQICNLSEFMFFLWSTPYGAIVIGFSDTKLYKIVCK